MFLSEHDQKLFSLENGSLVCKFESSNIKIKFQPIRQILVMTSEASHS